LSAVVKKLIGLEPEIWEDIDRVRVKLGIFSVTQVIRMAVKSFCNQNLGPKSKVAIKKKK
jgi:hypothetical protein